MHEGAGRAHVAMATLAAHQPRYSAPVAAAPPTAIAQPPAAPAAVDPAAGVPLHAEDRRVDAAGNLFIRKYARGRLLGKVRRSSAK